jgi:dolichol-phosphate mannosyltransferase
MNKSLTTISNMFTDLDITDMETCYKLFRRDIIQSIDIREDRFGFEPEITVKVSQMRCRVYECAITYTPRTYEEGKKINWKDGIRALYCILHYGAPGAPLPMQLVIYLCIGSVCAIINVIVFSQLYNSGISLLGSVFFAFIVAAVANYFMCILILFQHNVRWSTGGEIIAYLVTIVSMGLLDYGTTVLMTWVGVTAIFSKIVAVCVGFVGNFVFRKVLVFPKQRPVRI